MDPLTKVSLIYLERVGLHNLISSNCHDLLYELQPRCALEQLAAEIFHFHVDSKLAYDKCNSGAEWWVQIRPSPPAGRYSILEGDDPASKNSISFHWDKDEDLRLLTNDVLYIHPHLSTVTYLTQTGVPTMVLPCLKDCTSGSKAEFKFHQKNDSRGQVCWPQRGKHLKFDGRLLHAAPEDLMDSNLLKQQMEACNITNSASSQDKQVIRRKRRVTFLVNIWLNHTPLGVEPFPDSMLDKLSQVRNEQDYFCVNVQNIEPTRINLNATVAKDLQTFVWTLGSCVSSEDSLTVKLPLQEIRNNKTIELCWTDETVAIQHHLPTLAERKESKTIIYEEDEHDDANKRPRTDGSVNTHLAHQSCS